MYLEVNEENKNHMKGYINSDIEFEWEDKELVNSLIGKFELLHIYDIKEQQHTEELKVQIDKINKLIKSFNDRNIDASVFLIDMDKELKVLLSEFPDFYYRRNGNIEWYKDRIEIFKRVLISGVGGIGKSYFLYYLENELQKHKINTLCLYGKYTKSISKELLEEILQVSNEKEFVFIIDAFNELDDEIQELIIQNLDNMLKSKNLRIILSYRTNAISNNKIQLLENAFKRSYLFNGVSYESALSVLIKTYGVNISKFEEILETRNPLYLKMLIKILSNKKLTEELLNSTTQITYILEQYIKNTIDNETWQNTKTVSKYMYEKEDKQVTETEIESLLGDKSKKYIYEMTQRGFLSFYNYDGEIYYVFNMETLADYLIARNLNVDLENNGVKEMQRIINEKIQKMYSVGEAFILVICDRYSNDILKAMDIIINSKLKSFFDFDIIKRVRFQEDQIKDVQNVLEISLSIRTMFSLGGFRNKPFNCTNYFNEYFKQDNKRIYDINNYENTYYSNVEAIRRLHNSMYYIINVDINDKYIEEIFWFSLWCTATPNDDLRNIAVKVLFNITDKYNEYAKELIITYKEQDEDYIKNAIIFVLSSLSKNRIDEIKDFLTEVLSDYNEINAERIYNISKALYGENKYIELNKRNLFKEIHNVKANDMIDSLLLEIDMYDKNLLHFQRFNKKNELKMTDQFIYGSKDKIAKWNNEVTQAFSCMKNGDCCGWLSVEELINELYPLYKEIKIISPKKCYIIFQIAIEEIFKKYNYEYEKHKERFDFHIEKFENSLFKKCVSLAENTFFGSMMCNYYTEEFQSFNQFEDKVGYCVCNPYEYGIDLNIHSPISIYNEDIDKINHKIIKNLELKPKNKNWWEDKTNAIENVKNLIKPIEYKGQKWVPISLSIHMVENDENNDWKWRETYDLSCTINSDRTLKGIHDDRYLTIENRDYDGNIKDYKEYHSEQCCNIKNVKYQSKHFKETYLVLPPSNLIQNYSLTFCEKDATWRNSNNEVIIFSDNNECDFYNEDITSTIVVREDIINDMKGKNKITFFAYTERYLPKVGYNDKKTSLHIEFNNEEIIKLFNNGNDRVHEDDIPKECKNCKYGFYEYRQKVIKESKFDVFITDLLGDDIWNEEDEKL